MCVEYIYIYLVFEAGTVKLWLCLVKISRHGGFLFVRLQATGISPRFPSKGKRRQWDCSRHRWKTRFRVFPGKTFSMVERTFQWYLFENLIILAITRQLLTHEGGGREGRGNRACSLDVNLHCDAVSKLLPRYLTEDDANFAISPTK